MFNNFAKTNYTYASFGVTLSTVVELKFGSRVLKLSTGGRAIEVHGKRQAEGKYREKVAKTTRSYCRLRRLVSSGGSALWTSLRKKSFAQSSCALNI